MDTNMDTHEHHPSRRERRLHTRTPIGLPVRVFFAGRTIPVTVELRDVSLGGCYFRGASAPTAAKLAFGFVLPHRQVCVAAGQVLRVDRDGFAATISRTSDAFLDFLIGLSSDPIATHAA